jgi:hypothetical protein
MDTNSESGAFRSFCIQHETRWETLDKTWNEISTTLWNTIYRTCVTWFSTNIKHYSHHSMYIIGSS